MPKNNPFHVRYRDNLKDCLEYISSNPKVSTLVNAQIVSKIRTNKLQLASNGKTKNYNISFGPFELNAKDLFKCGTNPKSHISIGGEVKFDCNGNFFQAISLCFIAEPLPSPTSDNELTIDNTLEAEDTLALENINLLRRLDIGKTHIIRRFHFDIDAQQTEGDRPVFHFQYGGNLLDDQKMNHQYEIFSSIDLPRIPSLPLDLIQTLNLIFSQIQTELSSVFKDPRWRNIVLENDKIWDDFYFSAINNRNKTQTLYERLCSYNIFA